MSVKKYFKYEKMFDYNCGIFIIFAMCKLSMFFKTFQKFKRTIKVARVIEKYPFLKNYLIRYRPRHFFSFQNCFACQYAIMVSMPMPHRTATNNFHLSSKTIERTSQNREKKPEKTLTLGFSRRKKKVFSLGARGNLWSQLLLLFE